MVEWLARSLGKVMVVSAHTTAILECVEKPLTSGASFDIAKGVARVVPSPEP
jgi:hypothetical protein